MLFIGKNGNELFIPACGQALGKNNRIGISQLNMMSSFWSFTIGEEFIYRYWGFPDNISIVSDQYDRCPIRGIIINK